MTTYELDSNITAQWVRDSLHHGPSLSLSKLVDKIFSWDKVIFKTFANGGLDSEQLYNFSSGGKVESDSADDWIMDVVIKPSLAEGYLCVIEDWRAKRGSPFIKEMNLPALFMNDEVYYLYQRNDPRLTLHWQRAFSNSTPSFHAFLLPNDIGIKIGMNIDFAILHQAANKVKKIVCGAYDGEGYIVGVQVNAK